MSILIKGMEMPKRRGEYTLLMFVHSDGTATIEGAYCQFEGEPFVAIPVPPHDRLIEEGKVLDIVFEWCPDDDGSVGKDGDLREMLDDIEALPTIIPEEKMKEET